MRISGVLTASIFVATTIGCVDSHPKADSSARIEADRDESHRVLDAIVFDVLDNSDLAELRSSYIDAKDFRFALVNNHEAKLLWPPNYVPTIPGYKCESRIEETGRIQDSPLLLGIRLDKFNLGRESTSPFEGNVVVTLLNVGRIQDGSRAVGGTSVHYEAKLREGTWLIQWVKLEGQ